MPMAKSVTTHDDAPNQTRSDNRWDAVTVQRYQDFVCMWPLSPESAIGSWRRTWLRRRNSQDLWIGVSRDVLITTL